MKQNKSDHQKGSPMIKKSEKKQEEALKEKIRIQQKETEKLKKAEQDLK